MREVLFENPELTGGSEALPRQDVLSSVLGTIRVSVSLQFCLAPSGNWQTDPAGSMSRLLTRPGPIMPFHVVAEGECWLKMSDRQEALEAGDVVLFPFASRHDLGAGDGSSLVNPTRDLPPRPWREIPVMRYGSGDAVGVRLLCGYLQCDAMKFAPLRLALPHLIHVWTRGLNDGDWLRAIVRQMIAEVDNPRSGGVAMLPRLTEIIFIEILRHQIAASPAASGLLGALSDPGLGTCLALIHGDPYRDWSLEALAAAAGRSRSVLAERFQAILGTSPIRYVRDWRLQLAGEMLSTTRRSIAAVAHEAGYATEAAFNRAFARSFGTPPAAWRQERAG